MSSPLKAVAAADVSKGEDRRLGETHLALNDRVRDALRDAIIDGEFKPGDRLIEGRLADRFGVSRNPVREALKALNTEGIVEIVPRRGAFVSVLSHAEICEVIELRAALEGLGAKLAARRLDPAAAKRLPSILAAGEVAEKTGDIAELNRLNDLFHAALAQASSNRYLSGFIRTLRGKTHWLFTGIPRERALESWREHAAIMRAVLDRDAEMAELLASRHVTNVGGDLISGARMDDGSAASPASDGHPD